MGQLTKRGPSYGNYPNAVKFLLVVKPEKENLARKLFNSTNIEITSTSACHLGAEVGSEESRKHYIKTRQVLGRPVCDRGAIPRR